MLFTACLKERTAGGWGLWGLFGTTERTVWSPLWWQFPDMRQKKKKAVWQGLSPHFIGVSDKAQLLLSSHEDVPSLLCGKHKSSRLLENNNLVSEKPLYKKETTVFTDAAMQWHDPFFQPQKSSTEMSLCPWAHAKVNVVGVLRTLQPQRITVDAPREYIYSHMRTAIITDVFLEDKAGPYVVSP